MPAPLKKESALRCCVGWQGKKNQLATVSSGFWAGDRLFRLLAGDRFVPTFGRRPFRSDLAGDRLFHLLAGDHFVPSFGGGDICVDRWPALTVYFLKMGECREVLGGGPAPPSKL